MGQTAIMCKRRVDEAAGWGVVANKETSIET